MLVLTKTKFCYSRSTKGYCSNSSEGCYSVAPMVIPGSSNSCYSGSIKGCYWRSTPRAVFEGSKATGVFAFGEEESPKGVAVGLGKRYESSAFRAADPSPAPGRRMSPLLSKSVFLVFVLLLSGKSFECSKKIKD